MTKAEISKLAAGYMLQRQLPGEVDKMFAIPDMTGSEWEFFQAELSRLDKMAANPHASSGKVGILNEALKTVADRGESYGTVEENFNRIARLWNSHLVNRGIVDDPRIVSDPEAHNGVTATDVAMMMALVKIARLELDDQHHDSWVDLAGYAACGGELGAEGRNSA